MAVDLGSALPTVYSTISTETDITTFCRICATTSSGSLFSIFSQEGELWDVAEKIGRCLPIIVLQTDTLPLNICIQCLMKLNTSYELVITALNSDAKLKARFDFNEDAIELEAPEGDHLTGVFVKQEEPGSEVKADLSDTVEVPGIYGCEIVISSETGNNEKVEVRDSIMTEVNPDTFQDQNKISEKSSGNAESVRLQEECYKSRVEFDIETSNEELLKNSCNETSDGKLMSMDLPLLTIYGPAVCDLCNVTYTDMDEFDSHVVDQHLQKHKWQCLHCDNSFENSQDLVLHKVVTHGEEPVCCGRCQERKIKDGNIGDEVIQEGWLKESETHIDENKIYANNNSKNSSEFYCELCYRNFCDEVKLKDHYLVHSSQPVVCSRCGLKCSSSYELSVHKRNHSRNVREERYTCDMCRKTFLDYVMYNIHRRNCGSKHYTCNLCDRTFWRKYSLQLHMKVHNQEQREYECDCGQKFDTHSKFEAHKKTHQRVTTMKCVTCRKVFTNETFYKRHRYIHDPEYWDRFKCQTCQRPFRDAHALKNHMQLHDGIKPHMCDLCGRTYNRFANMLKHRKLHKPQNLWEHNCTHCEAKFERLKDLMSHMEQAHMAGDPAAEDAEGRKSSLKWICRFCGKRISTKLSLQDHERIHTGAKPYICEWCGREFRSRPNLLQHHLTHTGDRKHACAVCGKRFGRKSFIAQHMRVHTGEKPFECDLCGKRFTQAGDMRSELSLDYGPPKEYHSETSKPLTQSESAAGRRPSLVLTQWPSSSTLCKSDSFRMSEISINMDGYQQGMDKPTPQPQQHSPLVYEHPKHHSIPGGELISVRPESSPISNLTEPRRISSHTRDLIVKFKSLPKLMPVKKSGSAGSCGSNSRAKKGVRWKPMTDSPGTKSLDFPGLEMEKMCSSTSGVKYKYPMNRDAPDVKFTGFEFPVVKPRFTESLYCDLCQQKMCHILSSPNPEKVGYEKNLKRSVSAPLIVSEHTENSCGLDRDQSLQNKFIDKLKTRRESSPGTRLECKPEVTECTSFCSQSVPNITFGQNRSLPIESQKLGKTDSDCATSVCASKEHLRGNVSPIHNSTFPEIPTAKTSVVPNSELQMDASFPPTSRKDSDIFSESSLDAASWKSADWTTLLGSDVLSS